MTLPPKRTRLNKPRLEGTLKSASARLVEACGGLARTSDLLGNVGKTQVHRYTDDAETDEFKIGQVRLLERFCGEPIVTASLAAEQGCALVQLQVEGDAPLDIDFAVYGRESTELFNRYIAAMSDRRLSAREAGKMKEQLIRVMRALAAMLPDLDAAMKD